MVKVCVCGGAGGIGQPLSLLMVTNPLVSQLSILDLNIAMVPAAGVAADLSHIEYPCKVKGYSMVVGSVPKDFEHMQECLSGAKLVLIPAGMPRKPGQTRADLLTINADIAKGLVEACAKFCPDAVVALIVNPVNSVVPAMCELWQKAGLDTRKIVGVSTLDVVRANKFVSDKLSCDTNAISIPVIGGHAGKTILPLFSQDNRAKTISADDIAKLDARVQEAGTEVVEAKAGKGSATLSMAYAGARLAKAVLIGLTGGCAIECAYVRCDVMSAQGLKYFASKVEFGPDGVKEVYPIGTLSGWESKRLQEVVVQLKGEVDDGLAYAAKNTLNRA